VRFDRYGLEKMSAPPVSRARFCHFFTGQDLGMGRNRDGKPTEMRRLAANSSHAEMPGNLRIAHQMSGSAKGVPAHQMSGAAWPDVGDCS